LLTLFFSLGFLVKKIHESQILEIVDKIADELIKCDEKKSSIIRDITSLGLKKVIAEAPSKEGPNIVKRLTGRLISTLNRVKTYFIFTFLNYFIVSFSKKIELDNLIFNKLVVKIYFLFFFQLILILKLKLLSIF
jgi:hypothetical protein